VDVEDYRRTSQQLWDAMAPGWERWRGQLADALRLVRERLIRELAPRPGETVLELGAGTGETGFEAAAVLGDGGRLLSTDFPATWSRSPAAAAASWGSGTWTTG
jgi:ubiquinone/menaquinone biosynthesis C-methylase UbiE